MVHSKINISNEVAKFHKELTGHASFMIGFPGNLNNDFSDLYPFFDFIINNVGDPFDTGASYKMDSKWYEKKVLSFFHKKIGRAHV